MDKAARLLELARKRQRTCWPEYKCIGEYHDGAYECDFVSPYTKSAGNLDARIMVLLQDWSSDKSLQQPLSSERQGLGYTPGLQTNRHLAELLRCHFGLQLCDVFATNVFPFVKPGAMSARIRMKDLVRAAREFALPQIEIIRPPLAVCLGKAGFNAVRRAAGADPVATLEEGIRSPFLFGSTLIWCQAHTGARGTNHRNQGGVDRVSSDWARMAATYNRR